MVFIAVLTFLDYRTPFNQPGFITDHIRVKEYYIINKFTKNSYDFPDFK